MQRSKHIDVLDHSEPGRVAWKFCVLQDLEADILIEALASGNFSKGKREMIILFGTWKSVDFERY